MSAAVSAGRGMPAQRIGLYVFIILSALFFMLPLVVVLLNSVKSMEEIRQGALLSLPHAPTLEYFRIAWSSACSGLECRGISPGLMNSIKIVIPAVVLSILVGAINGYALSQWRGKAAARVSMAIAFGLFVPYQTMMYPSIMLTRSAGIFGTYPGIILIHVVYGIPFTTLLFRNFYVGLPDELTKAARIEGASFLQTFRHVMLPLSINMIVVVAVLQFTGIWNDYFLGSIYAGNASAPMTVQLNNLINNAKGEVALNVNMAATILTAIPTILVYLAAGRYFVRGITAGAVKG